MTSFSASGTDQCSSTFTSIHPFNFLFIYVRLAPDGRLFELRISCGPDYPAVPPKVRFISRINLSCVNQSTGVVESALPELAHWNRNMTIEKVLSGIKTVMMAPQNRRLPQPPEGTMF